MAILRNDFSRKICTFGKILVNRKFRDSFSFVGNLQNYFLKTFVIGVGAGFILAKPRFRKLKFAATSSTVLARTKATRQSLFKTSKNRILQGPIVSGISLVELLVVVAVTALLTTIVYPTTQVLQQRDREHRLKKVLKNVQSKGIDDYTNYVVAKIKSSGLTADQEAFAIASGAAMGLLYPLKPRDLEKSVGTRLYIPIDSGFPAPLSSVTVTIERRFIRKVPPHPFISWLPNSHWEFRAATETAAGGPWFASSSWPAIDATGVIEFKSVGAGITLNGGNSDDLYKE
ncbi:hypothetical protein HYY75_07810 [bacterium]|nr:hypothetical protein [bacterium]